MSIARVPPASVLRRLRAGLRRVAAGLLLGAAGWAQAADIGQQIERIEANHGHEPARVLTLLAPLEASARAAGGNDLVTFLAAWGYAHGALDKPTVADAAIAELNEIGERERDPMARAAAYALKGTMLQYAGRLDAAYGWVVKAVPSVRQSRSPAFQYWIFTLAGDLATSLGRLDEAVHYLEEAGTAAREDRNHRRSAQAALRLAPLHLVRGHPDRARQDLETAHALAARGGETHLVMSAQVLGALVAEQSGEPGHARQLRELAPGVRGAEAELAARLELAALNLSAGNDAAALQQAQRAGALANEARDPGATALATIHRGMALLGLARHRTQIQEARRVADIGFDLLHHSSRRDEELLLLHRYSALLDRRGESAASNARTREALTLETELVRQDRLSTVLELQRKSSSAEQQRALDALQHENRLQAVELGRSRREQQLTLAMLGALGLGALASLLLFARVRKANRQLAARHAELEYVSHHDRITRLPNRRMLDAHGKRIAAQPDGRFLGIGIAIKRFGLIVGNLGHELGDRLLEQIGQRLAGVVALHGGTLYRLDGLSFGCLVPERGVPQDPFELLAALARAMEAPFVIDRQELMVTACMGAAAYPRHGSTPAQVARCVELATLHARALPGTSYIVYSEEMLPSTMTA